MVNSSQNDSHIDDFRPWTRKEVAKYLSCSVYQVARDVKAGIIPAVRLGSRWYFDPSKIRKLVGME